MINFLVLWQSLKMFTGSCHVIPFKHRVEIILGAVFPSLFKSQISRHVRNTNTWVTRSCLRRCVAENPYYSLCISTFHTYDTILRQWFLKAEHLIKYKRPSLYDVSPIYTYKYKVNLFIQAKQNDITKLCSINTGCYTKYLVTCISWKKFNLAWYHSFETSTYNDEYLTCI